jgi:predicted TIM-barrel fold metal-dependent hydrolase
MARRGFRVIDSDMHVVEPADLWSRYLEPRYRGRAPEGLTNGPRDISVLVDGQLPNRPGVATDDWNRALAAHMAPREKDYAFAAARGWDAGAQLEAMDREGIDRAVLFPSRGLFVLGSEALEADFAAAIARAYNDWLGDFCSADRERLYGAAMVAPHDPKTAAQETRRCVEELGFRSVFLLPGRVGGRDWHHPDYDPLWAECERQQVPVSFHGGGPDQLTDFGLGFRGSLMMWHTFSHCLGPMAALVSFIGGGVFDRFPGLRAGFLEGNCSWAPWLVHRLEDQYLDYVGRHEVRLARRPSEYFVDHCLVSIEADEEPAALYVQHFGDDNLGFSTDFPHPDAKFPHAVERFLELPLPEESKRKCLWDNCARFYGLAG